MDILKSIYAPVRYMIMAFVLGMMQACQGSGDSDGEIVIGIKTMVSQPQRDALSPFFSDMGNGKVLLSWVDKQEGQGTVFFVLSTDGGQTFSSQGIVGPSKGLRPNGENIPKIAISSNGLMVAAWCVGNPNPHNKYSDLVYYSISSDQGHSWGAAKKLVMDTASYDQRYLDMAQLKNGKVGITWLDNRKKTSAEGSTLYFSQLNEQGTFVDEKAVAETTCQCCRTDVLVDQAGHVHIAFRDILNDSIRDISHVALTEEGMPISSPERISADHWAVKGCPHSGPAILENEWGFHYTWFTMGNGNGVYYCNQKGIAKPFSQREKVSGEGTAKHPQLEKLDDGRIVIVWDEIVGVGEARHSQIGLQVRSPDGNPLITTYVTEAGEDATFPVLKNIGGAQVLLAYTEKTLDKGKVVIRKITWP